MIVTQLRLRRFKKFNDWTMSLAPGLNIIRGGNETGKTTLMEAIFEGLFGDLARDQMAARWRSWGEQRLGEITMELDVGDARYLLRKDLEAGTILLQSVDGRERIESPRDVQRRLQEWTGLETEAAFRATAFVGQADLGRVTGDRRWLGAHLTRVSSGAGAEGVQQSLQWLAEQRARLTSTAVGIKGLQNRLAELHGQLGSLRQRQERAQRHRIQLRETVRRLEDVEAAIAEKQELARAARAAADLRHRQQTLQEEETAIRERLARAEGLEARLAQLDGELSEFSSQQEALIADLFQARRQYLQLESGARSAAEEAARAERALEHLGTVHHRAQRLGNLGWILAGAGAVGIVGGGLLVSLLSVWVGWVLLVASAVATVVGARYRGRIAEAGLDYRSQEQRVLELRRRTEALQVALSEAAEKVAGRLRAVGTDSLEEAERRFSAYMELLREREEVRASLRHVGGADPGALEARLAEITAELAGVRASLEALPKPAQALPPGGVEAIEQQTRALATELQELREHRARLEEMLDELRERGDATARLEEEIAALQRRVERDRDSLEIIDLTARLLEDARARSTYPARELLERRTGEYLSVATGGAYSRVALDEREARPKVWVGAAGSWQEVADLGQATSDQLSFCLRLALLDLMTGDRRVPLFLDEPFAYLDEHRRRAMLTLLTAAARDHQVVLFTAWPHYDLHADKVVTLDRVAVASPTT
jgi:uncharacterized protein YhaN